RYNASFVYTQTLLPDRLLNDSPGPRDAQGTPAVVQLCGNDPEIVVCAAPMVVDRVDTIDLNLGCPQDAALEGHYGGYYLFEEKHWPKHCWTSVARTHVSHSLPVPISVKTRLCQNTPLTPALSARLVAAGASWIILYARHVFAWRRRLRVADLEQVRALERHVSTGCRW
ncbi:hypothetical protein LXA43DRAFT_905050, partial [Ganoderma leucocontextum]